MKRGRSSEIDESSNHRQATEDYLEYLHTTRKTLDVYGLFNQLTHKGVSYRDHRRIKKKLRKSLLESVLPIPSEQVHTLIPPLHLDQALLQDIPIFQTPSISPPHTSLFGSQPHSGSDTPSPASSMISPSDRIGRISSVPSEIAEPDDVIFKFGKLSLTDRFSFPTQDIHRLEQIVSVHLRLAEFYHYRDEMETLRSFDNAFKSGSGGEYLLDKPFILGILVQCMNIIDKISHITQIGDYLT